MSGPETRTPAQIAAVRAAMDRIQSVVLPGLVTDLQRSRPPAPPAAPVIESAGTGRLQPGMPGESASTETARAATLPPAMAGGLGLTARTAPAAATAHTETPLPPIYEEISRRAESLTGRDLAGLPATQVLALIDNRKLKVGQFLHMHIQDEARVDIRRKAQVAVNGLLADHLTNPRSVRSHIINELIATMAQEGIEESGLPEVTLVIEEMLVKMIAEKYKKDISAENLNFESDTLKAWEKLIRPSRLASSSFFAPIFRTISTPKAHSDLARFKILRSFFNAIPPYILAGEVTIRAEAASANALPPAMAGDLGFPARTTPEAAAQRITEQGNTNLAGKTLEQLKATRLSEMDPAAFHGIPAAKILILADRGKLTPRQMANLRLNSEFYLEHNHSGREIDPHQSPEYALAALANACRAYTQIRPDIKDLPAPITLDTLSNIQFSPSAPKWNEHRYIPGNRYRRLDREREEYVKFNEIYVKLTGYLSIARGAGYSFNAGEISEAHDRLITGGIDGLTNADINTLVYYNLIGQTELHTIARRDPEKLYQAITEPKVPPKTDGYVFTYAQIQDLPTRHEDFAFLYNSPNPEASNNSDSLHQHLLERVRAGDNPSTLRSLLPGIRLILLQDLIKDYRERQGEDVLDRFTYDARFTSATADSNYRRILKAVEDLEQKIASGDYVLADPAPLTILKSDERPIPPADIAIQVNHFLELFRQHPMNTGDHRENPVLINNPYILARLLWDGNIPYPGFFEEPIVQKYPNIQQFANTITAGDHIRYIAPSLTDGIQYYLGKFNLDSAGIAALAFIILSDSFARMRKENREPVRSIDEARAFLQKPAVHGRKTIETELEVARILLSMYES